MTLHELLGIARHMLNANREEMRELGEGILSLLGESQPCGWPVVESYSGTGHLTCEQAGCGDPGGMHGHGGKPAVVWCGVTLTPGEARAIAAALLRGADEAEGAAL